MKKIVPVLAVLISASTMFAGENLLPNGDFEELMTDSSRPVRWSFRQIGAVSYSCDSKESASGKISVLFTFKPDVQGEEGYIMFRDNKMDIFKAGGKYSFSMQYKSSAFNGGVAIILTCYKGDTVLSKLDSPGEKVDSDTKWKKIELSNAEIPKDTDKVSICCLAKNKSTGGGQIWIDNVTAEKVE